jgi:hypothetical protein
MSNVQGSGDVCLEMDKDLCEDTDFLRLISSIGGGADPLPAGGLEPPLLLYDEYDYFDNGMGGLPAAGEYRSFSPPVSPASARLTDAASEGPSEGQGGEPPHFFEALAGFIDTPIGVGINTSNNEHRGPRRKRPRSHPDDEDARLIALETELHLKKLNISPDSREGKVERRKVQNRMSAQMHRERKRAYIETLEDEIAGRDATIAEMAVYIRQLEDTVRAGGGVVAGLPASGDRSLSGQTTSESESDAGYSSSTSAPYKERKTSGAPLGLSLFSLVFMMSFGFTLMAKPDMLGSILSSPSAHSWEAGAGAGALSRAERGDGWPGHGRVLLASAPPAPAAALVATDDDDDMVISSVSSSVSAAGPAPAPALAAASRARRVTAAAAAAVASGNTSLWNFDAPVAHLYCPHPAAARDGSGRAPARANGDAVSGALVTTFPKVPSSPAQASLRGSAGVKLGSREGRSVEQRALIHADAMSQSRSPQNTMGMGPDFFPSQILMTEGKALLDPSLVQSPRVVHRNSFGFANPSDEVVHIHRMAGGAKREPEAAAESEIGTALVASSSVGSTWGSLGSNRGSHYAHSSASAGLGADRAVETSASPQFVMMLPLNSVKWGTSWDEDDSLDNPLTQLLKTLQSNSTSPSGPVDTDSYWIEIGCSVIKAQLVKNVTLA